MEYFVVLVVWKEIHNFGAFKIRRSTDFRFGGYKIVKVLVWQCPDIRIRPNVSHFGAGMCDKKNVLALNKKTFFVLCLTF